eukprot:XP_014038084.1 PREDICTED: tyrosine-protein phosphatase non-receptor type 1-like isoform X2 [Salmo salar]
MDQQFEEIDSSGQWQNLYNEIRSQASDYSYQMAKRPENQNRNRYRDVSPYDHSRVKLENSENDYINASLVMVEEAQRIYILSQGPLKNTCGHFWLMVWEQNSKAVIMLNRIIEKGSEKCAQYWPTAEGHQLSYTDTGFVVTLVKEEDMSYYVIRVLELRNTEMDKRKDPSSVDIQKVLLDMREYRMGLIQTPDQLRFSYRAVLEGAKYIMGDCSVQKMWRELSKEDQDPVSDSESLLPTQPPSKCPLEKYNGSRVSRGEEGGDAELGERTTGTESPYKEQDVDESTANARKRPRDERVSNCTPKITDPKQTKPSITDSEKKRKRPRTSDH